MYGYEEMNKWDYATAWSFFTENAKDQYIPESELYVRSMNRSETIDIRGDKDARKKLLKALKPKTLILMDGASLNGKTTFANRLAPVIDAKVVDIDIVCIEWFEKKRKNMKFPEKIIFEMEANKLADMYILKNLERIVKNESTKSVILVGAYLEVIYRTIIARTLGRKYFNHIASIYCCSKNFKEIEMMFKKRKEEFGSMGTSKEAVLEQYNYSKRLLEFGGAYLGFGMDSSFIADISVSDMFV